MKEAAQIVRETVPNYAYVSDFVKSVRRSPLGSFAAFPAEIYRTGANTLTRDLKEVRDPVRKQWIVTGKHFLQNQIRMHN